MGETLMLSRFATALAAVSIAVAALTSFAAPSFAQGNPPAAAPPAQPPGTAVRVRGTINSLTGNVLNFTTREGETININLAPDYTVNAAIPLTLADITNNAYIGVVAETDPAGNLIALDVRVFPESANRANARVFPWDLTPTSTMANAIVADVQQQPQQTMVRVTYPEGEKMVMIGPETPIWTTTPGDASLLVAGAYAVIGTRKLDDGTYTATSVTVEKDGTRPTN
jgi:hypothetical protein